MTVEKALEIADTKGAFRESFFGRVLMTIKAGSVKELEVVETFRETETAA